MKNWNKYFNEIELYISYILLVIMLVVATIGVFFRYVVNNSLGWSEEVCRYALMWISFTSAAYAVLANKHLAVDLLSSLVLKNHPKTLRVFMTINSIIWVLFLVVFSYWGWKQVASSFDLSPTMGFSMKYIYACLPVGCILMAIRVIQVQIREFRSQ